MKDINIPVYFTFGGKTSLLSINWFRNAHFFQQNKVKQALSEVIKPQLKDFSKLKNTYSIIYSYHYKSKVSDMPNVTALASKWINDVLQDLDLVPNDNVQYLLSEHHFVGTYDKENPRVEITIKEHPDGFDINALRSIITESFGNSSL